MYPCLHSRIPAENDGQKQCLLKNCCFPDCIYPGTTISLEDQERQRTRADPSERIGHLSQPEPLNVIAGGDGTCRLRWDAEPDLGSVKADTLWKLTGKQPHAN